MQIFNIEPSSTSRWRTCIDSLKEEMPHVASRMFVDETFLQYEKAHVSSTKTLSLYKKMFISY